MTKIRIALALLATVALSVFLASGCYKGTTVDLNQDLVITGTSVSPPTLYRFSKKTVLPQWLPCCKRHLARFKHW